MTSPARILIVDDDPEILSVLSDEWKLRGYATLGRFCDAQIAAAMIGEDSGFDPARALRGTGWRSLC